MERNIPRVRSTYIGPLTATVTRDGGGLPRWMRRTSNVPPSHPVTSATAVDLPAPSPPTKAIRTPPATSRFLTCPGRCVARPCPTLVRRAGTRRPAELASGGRRTRDGAHPAVRAFRHGPRSGRSPRGISEQVGCHEREPGADDRRDVIEIGALGEPDQLAALRRGDRPWRISMASTVQCFDDHAEGEQQELVLGRRHGKRAEIPHGGGDVVVLDVEREVLRHVVAEDEPPMRMHLHESSGPPS